MEVAGTIKMISDVQTFDSGFKKREVVVTTEEQYPQHILIEFVQDKVDLLDAYSVGNFVKVSINLRGREWTNREGVTRYFNSITGWRIEKGESEGGFNEPVTPSKPRAKSVVEDEDDDLPF